MPDPILTPAVRRTAGSVAVLVALLVLAGVCVHRKGDFEGYVAVGEIVLHGGHPYRDAPPRINTWPPVFSLLTVPPALLARVSPDFARGVWLLANVVVLLLVLRLLVRLVYDRPLTIFRRRPGVPLASAAVLVPLVIAHAGVAGNFYHIQVNLFVFALVLAGLSQDTKGNALAGGLAIGAAAAIRVMPVVFIPYLLWRRRWRTAAWASLALAVLSSAPALVYGWDGFVDLVTSWRASVGTGWGVAPMNQSVAAMFDRYLGHGVVPFATQHETTALLVESGRPVVLWATAAVLAVVTVLALVLFRGPMRRGGWVELTEWSVVFLVAATFGPVSWKAYFVVLLLPLMLLYAARRSDTQPRAVRGVATACLVLSVLCFALPSQDLLGAWVARNLQAASIFTIGSLALLGALFWLRRRVVEPRE